MCGKRWKSESLATFFSEPLLMTLCPWSFFQHSAAVAASCMAAGYLVKTEEEKLQRRRSSALKSSLSVLSPFLESLSSSTLFSSSR